MKINRIAAMFKTFGLEEKLEESFKQHYKKVMNMIKDPSVKENAYSTFSEHKAISLGMANISNSLQPIIEHYGYPKVLPKRVRFLVSHPDDPQSKNSDAYFVMSNEEDCILSITSEDFEDIELDSRLRGLIEHETQHFLKAIYYGSMTEYKASGEGWTVDYFSDDWEIQAYAMNIAKEAIKEVQDFIEAAVSGQPRERIEQIKASMSRNKMDLLSTFMVNKANSFFNDIEESSDIKLSPMLRKKYLQAAFRDFNTLFNPMISSF